MGWDAHSSVETGFDENDKINILDPRLRKVFAQAVKEVKKHSDTVDCILFMGSLDCSNCAMMLERATGESCYDDPWDQNYVILLNCAADWDFAIKEEDAWAYWSAKIFLETCAKEGLSIKFSW